MPARNRAAAAKARLYHAIKEAHLAHIVRVDLKSDLFAYGIDYSAQSVSGISSLAEIHDRVFAALKLKKTAQPRQPFLL